MLLLEYNVPKRGLHPLRSIDADLPWDHIAVDLVTSLRVSHGGNASLVVIVDTMTKFAVLRCMVLNRTVPVDQLKLVTCEGGSSMVKESVAHAVK